MKNLLNAALKIGTVELPIWLPIAIGAAAVLLIALIVIVAKTSKAKKIAKATLAQDASAPQSTDFSAIKSEDAKPVIDTNATTVDTTKSTASDTSNSVSIQSIEEDLIDEKPLVKEEVAAADVAPQGTSAPSNDVVVEAKITEKKTTTKKTTATKSSSATSTADTKKDLPIASDVDAEVKEENKAAPSEKAAPKAAAKAAPKATTKAAPKTAAKAAAEPVVKEEKSTATDLPIKKSLVAGEEVDDLKSIGKYQIIFNKNNEMKPYQFCLVANNGQVLFESESYKVKPNIRSIDAFKKAVSDGSFSIDSEKNGTFRYKLYNKSNTLIGVGEAFKTKVSCEKNIESVKKFSTSATILEDLSNKLF